MKRIRKIVYIILLFLNIILNVYAVPEARTLSIHQHHLKHKPHFIQDDDFLASPGQVFGTCYEMTLYHKTIKVKCTFIMETREPVDSLNHLRVCNFTLKSFTEHDKKNYYIPLKVTAIDNRKAFLTITHIDYRRFYLLRFTDCRAIEIEMKLNNPMIAAQKHHLFDVIVTKDDAGFCQSKYCRMILDDQASIIVEKYNWMHEDGEIIAIASSPLRTNLVVDKFQKYWKNANDGLVRIYSVNYDGTIDMIKQYQAQAGPGHHYGAVTASTTSGFLTVCSTNKDSLSYAQFDLNGNLQFDGVWEDDKIDLMHTLRVHNLPDGGFLLVITICYKENNVKECGKNGDNVIVKKFDEFGRQMGSIDITRWKHIDVKKLHFFVDNDGEMCLSHVNGHDVEYDGTIRLNVMCFEDLDFITTFI